MAIHSGRLCRGDVRRVQAHPSDQPLQGRSPRAPVPALRAVPARRAARQGAVRGVGRGRGARRRSTECYRCVREVIGPLNAIGDHEGCRVEDGQVITPTRLQGGVEEALRGRAGSRSRVDAEYGGAGAPHALQVARRGDALRREHRVRACTRGSRSARPRSSSRSAPPEQKKLYCARMFGGAVGRHDVPHRAAGRQRRRHARRPTREAQRRRQLHDHAARRSSSPAATTISPRTSSTSCSRASTARPPAPRASRSSSCPSIRVDGRTARSASRNDVTRRRNIEHKMGINGSATCVLNFGDERQVHRLAGRRRRAS